MEKTVPRGQQIHIIVDNYSTRKHKNMFEWIEKKKRIFLHFIPASSSWLNMVERFFSTLTEKQIHRRVFTSVKYLEECLRDYVDTYNKNPQPLCVDKIGIGNYGENKQSEEDIGGDNIIKCMS